MYRLHTYSLVRCRGCVATASSMGSRRQYSATHYPSTKAASVCFAVAAGGGLAAVGAWGIDLLSKRLDRVDAALQIIGSERRSVGTDESLQALPATVVAASRRNTARQEAASHTPIVVLTGGPCAGKTTALEQIASKMEALGVRVFLLPEASTLMFGAGCPFPVGGTVNEMGVWEAAKLRLQEAMEDEFKAVANASSKPTLILCDRGMMDSKAYCASNHDWIDILEDNGWSAGKLLDRYDAVIHMVSTAHGAEDVYSGSNNVARRESVDEARGLDDRLQAAWKDHPGLAVVDNSTGWEDKLARTFDAVVASPPCQANLPEAVANTRYYNRGPSNAAKGGHTIVNRVHSTRDAISPTKVFLLTKGEALKVWPQLESEAPTEISYRFLTGDIDRTLKHTSYGQTNTYVLSTWIVGPGSRGSWSTERLTKRMYRLLLTEADPNIAEVKVRRQNIVLCGRLVTLDSIIAPTHIQLLSFRGGETQFREFDKWNETLAMRDVSQDPVYRTRRSLACAHSSASQVAPAQ